MLPNTLPDSIERSVDLRVDLGRAWELIATPKGLMSWFCRLLEGEIAPGQTVHLTWPDDAGPAIIEAVEPMKRLAFRWRPGFNPPETVLDADLTTLVEFLLEPRERGARLRVVESGFAAIKLEDAASRRQLNVTGWEACLAKLVANAESS